MWRAVIDDFKSRAKRIKKEFMKLGNKYKESTEKENQLLKKGSKVRVDRWDGNGISEYVTVKGIIDDLVIFEEGTAYWGENLIWREKSRDRYWNNSHCFIEWNDYYTEE